ncbi:AAA family ATPase [Candidatus Uabimicrobium sp. HlEnr_7]|uniref:AAA family ATPase n=1 Tax=Candidatus Uabimicrobium helgolandensis TaxID=3095367 RepID=UPI003558F507
MELIPEDKKTVEIPASGSWPASMHGFEEESIWAVNAALTSGRPLLIRGEPGVGKSQLARAAAQALGRIFISEVVYAHSECCDLLWKFDAVARLGEAQVLAGCREDERKEKLDPLKFLNPGSMWWAFNWESAKKQWDECVHKNRMPKEPEGWSEENGCVLLIDEIDKADANLPNGLLEVFGNGAFTVPYFKEDECEVTVKGDVQPLVIITTNEERELPRAFLRRCMVLNMKLPEKNKVIERGRLHFKGKCKKVHGKVYEEAAELLWKDREKALDNGLPAPGQAEYFDLLRALSKMGSNEKEQLRVLGKISEFALKKHAKDN